MGFQDLIKKEAERRVTEKAVTEGRTPPSTVGGPAGSQDSLTNWDKNFASIPDEFAKDVEFHFDDKKLEDANPLNDVFMNALNGQYKAALDKYGPKDGFVRNNFTALGKSAWEIASYVKNTSEKGFKTKQEVQAYQEKLTKLKESFVDNWNKAQTSLTTDKEGNARSKPIMYLNEDDYRLRSEDQWRKETDSIFVRIGETQFGTNLGSDLKVSLAPGSYKYYREQRNLSEYAGYKVLKVREDMAKEHLETTMKPIVSSWLTNSFDRWDSETLKETDRVENKKAGTQLGMELLTWTSKYGQDPELKKKAGTLLGQVKNLNYQQKQDFIKKNASTLTQMSDDLGYYGSKTLYSKMNKSFNSPVYYPGDTVDERKDAFRDSRNVLPNLLRRQKEFDESTRELRSFAKTRMDQDLFGSKSGYKLSREDQIKKVLSEMLLTDTTKNIRSFDNIMGKLGSTMVSRSNTVTGGGAMGTVGSTTTTTRKKEYFTGYGQSGTRNEYKKAYDELVKTYKKRFNKTNIGNKFEQTAFISSLGYKRSQFVGQDSIDFTKDSGKASNANRIRSVVDKMKNDWEQNVNDGSVYITGTRYSHTVSKEGLQNKDIFSGKKMLKRYRDFFADQDSNTYDLSFTRETPVAGKSAYMFEKTNKNGKKEFLTIYMDRNKARKAGDLFVKNTFTSTYDWSFNLDGKWDMSWAQSNVGQDLKIVYNKEDGMKYLKGKLWDPETNEFRSINRALGNNDALKIREAEKMVRNIVSKLKALKESET